MPSTLGRYELIQLLSQGGMGEVYLARLSGAAGFEKPCIVKTILPSLTSDPQFLERFQHEARVLVHLQHANIAQVYDMGESCGAHFMALEYVAGVDLSQLPLPLPVPIALYLGMKMAEGLAYAHRKTGIDGAALGIVHRDVSPQNAMVSYDGEVKLIDFGLAKSVARSHHTLPATVMGKLGYMSPQQAMAAPVDHRTDIYSCAVVLWELLSGQPFIAQGTVGEMMAAMAMPAARPLSELRPEVGERLSAIVARALAVNPDQRYGRADELARALNEELVRSGAAVGAEEVGAFVREACPEAYAQNRKLISRLSSLNAKRLSPLPATAVMRAPRTQSEPAYADTRVHRAPRLKVALVAAVVIGVAGGVAASAFAAASSGAAPAPQPEPAVAAPIAAAAPEPRVEPVVEAVVEPPPPEAPEPHKASKRRAARPAKPAQVEPSKAVLSDEAPAPAAVEAELKPMPAEEPATSPTEWAQLPATAAPAPSAAHALMGRATATGGLFASVTVFNADAMIWNHCSLIIQGKKTYRLGGLSPGGQREVPLRKFELRVDSRFVKPNFVGVSCDEGQADFPVRF